MAHLVPAGIVALAAVLPAAAQEVLVNEEWLYSQTFGRIAAAPDGSFWAVWESRDEFCAGSTDKVMRHIGPDGRFLTGNLPVPSGCGSLGSMDVAVLDSGRFLVVFNEGFSGSQWITGRLFDPDGTPLGPDFTINDPSPDAPGRPRTAALTSGRFAVAWKTNAYEVYGRMVLSGGTLLPQQALSVSPNYADRVVLAPAAAGGVMAAWTRTDTPTAATHARMFDATFLPLGPEVGVSDPTEQSRYSDLDATPQGFLVTYTRYRSDPANEADVIGRLLDASGQLAGPEVVLNTTLAALQERPQVAVNSSGLALASWQGDHTGSYEIYGQLLALGATMVTRIGPEFLVNGTEYDPQGNEDVAVFGEHAFMALWVGYQDVNGDEDQLIRRYAFPASLAVAPGPDPAAPAQVDLLRPHGLSGSASITAYQTPGYGANPGAGDLDGAVDEALTGPGASPVYGPHVRAFRADGTPVAKVSYFAYGTLRYGVRPAGADIDGDVFSEILTTPGRGAVFGPHVRGWNVDGGPLAPISKVNFFAYQTLRWGARSAGGDVEGDGFQEILTGPGPGAVFGPIVRGFDFDGGTVSAIGKISFNAFGGTPRYGVTVGAADVESDGVGGYGDGFQEILAGVGPDPGFTGEVELYDFDGTAVAFKYQVTAFPTPYGAEVAGGDVDAGEVEEVVTAPGPDPASPANVVVWEWDAVTTPRDPDGPNLHRLGPADFVVFPGAAYGAKVAVGSFE